MDTLVNDWQNGFNGFSPAEIVNLYKFLCAYEKIESYRNDESFKRNYPELSDKLFAVLDQLSLKLDNCITVVQEELRVKYTSARRTKYIAFLYHFRNAIAHGRLLKNNNGQVEIKDFDNTVLTTSGIMDSQKVDEIIRMMITQFIL